MVRRGGAWRDKQRPPEEEEKHLVYSDGLVAETSRTHIFRTRSDVRARGYRQRNRLRGENGDVDDAVILPAHAPRQLRLSVYPTRWPLPRQQEWRR